MFLHTFCRPCLPARSVRRTGAPTYKGEAAGSCGPRDRYRRTAPGGGGTPVLHRGTGPGPRALPGGGGGPVVVTAGMAAGGRPELTQRADGARRGSATPGPRDGLPAVGPTAGRGAAPPQGDAAGR